MNHKLVECYIKDQLRKDKIMSKYEDYNIFCENGIIYVGTLLEICFEEIIRVHGYKTGEILILNYPEKNGNEEETLFYILIVIRAQIALEASFDLYQEVI